MTFEEITEKLKNPDKVAEGLADLTDYVKGLNSTIETAKAEIQKKDKSISDLKESNWALFLKVTGEPKKEETEEISPYDQLVKETTEEQNNGNN